MKRSALVLMLLGVIACGPTPPPTPPTPPVCRATLAFDVREVLTGVPIEGANVDLTGTDIRVGVTNEDGYVAWELLCGEYMAMISKDGYHSPISASINLVGNTQITVSLDKIIPLPQRLHVCGIQFCREDGTRWNWYGLTAFSLAYDISQGREDDVIRFLNWSAEHSVTIVRVLTTNYATATAGLFDLDPAIGRDAAERVLQLAAERGLYAELVGLAGTAKRTFDHSDHLQQLGALCEHYPNCLIEVANEPNHPSQASQVKDPKYLQSLRAHIPSHVLTALGAAHGPSDESQDYTGGDYVTVHGDRRNGEGGWRWVRHTREMQAQRDHHHHKPVVNDEPGRNVPNVDQHLALGLLTRLYSIGDTFHYAGGLRGKIPQGDELLAFLARQRAWQALPQDWTGRYSRATLAGDPIKSIDGTQVLRAYSSLRPTEGYVLGLRVDSESSIRWGNNWNAAYRIIEGKTRLWYVTK